MIDKDTLIGRKLMILTFTFYRIKTDALKEEKEYIQNSIMNHIFWKNSGFWESAIFESIMEEFESQKCYNLEENESKNDTILREKNLVLGQLASYAHNMLMFHVEKNEVKDLIIRFGKCFNILEFQLKELLVNNFFFIFIQYNVNRIQ